MKLPILHYPDKRLRTIAKKVSKVDDETRLLVKNMFETMYDAPGIGLAATQVDHHERIIVIDITNDKSSPICLINPEIIEKMERLSGKKVVYPFLNITSQLNARTRLRSEPLMKWVKLMKLRQMSFYLCASNMNWII